mgnify:CR=1 FL=1
MENMKRLFVPSKQRYAKGERPKVDCILCSVANKDPKVESLDIYHTENFIVSVNLFPYNPGHIMIFPKQHVLTTENFSNEEIIELHELQLLSLEVLKEYYNTMSFNLGYNIGPSSGASIEHLHLHIVPRYPREVGFIDVIGNARIIVEDPKDTVNKLTQAFKEKS